MIIMDNVNVNELEYQSQNIVNNLIKRLRQLELSVENLKKENVELKSEHYKDKQLSDMKDKLDRMKKDYYRGFPINKEEEVKINKFQDKYRNKYYGAIGGAFTYKFTPTSIGVVGEVFAPNGESLVFKDLS